MADISYSVIIPAYNEEKFLPATIHALNNAMAMLKIKGEVIVVDNNSSDGTQAIARDLGAIVIYEPLNQISRARNAGARAAVGKYLVFLDADTLISPNILEEAISNLSSRSCCAGGARVLFKENGFVNLSVKLWNFFSERLKVAAGCFIYCLKDAFNETGGFSEKVYAGEEIWFSLNLRKWGKKRGMDFKIINTSSVRTSSRKFEWYSPLRLAGMILIFTFFPFALRFRSLCGLWYKRP